MKRLKLSLNLIKEVCFVLVSCAFFILTSLTTVIDYRGFDCSLSPCIDTKGIDQSRLYNPITQEPTIKDRFIYVNFSLLAPSLFFVKQVLPETMYTYAGIAPTIFFIDKAEEEFTHHTHPNVVIDENDENFMKATVNKLWLLNLINIPIWLLFSIGMLKLARRKQLFGILWISFICMIGILSLIFGNISAERFG